MKNPHDQAVDLLEQVRNLANSPKVDGICDHLELLLAAYMDQQVDVDEIVGMPAGLSEKQHRIFCLLYKNLSKPVSNEAVMNALYHDDMDGGADPETVKVILCSMRKKLAGGRVRIDTVWGVGLKMVLSTEPDRSFFDGLKNTPRAGSYAEQFDFGAIEAKVFDMLFVAKGEAVQVDDLALAVYGDKKNRANCLWRTITRIREKTSHTPFILSNEFGVGYRLIYSAPVARERSTASAATPAKLEARKADARRRALEHRQKLKAETGLTYIPKRKPKESIAA